MTKNGKPSLRRCFVGIVLACWLLPLILMSGTLSRKATEQSRQQLDNTLLSSITYAANSVKHVLESVVAASRQATADGEIFESYLAFKADQDRTNLYERVTNYLGRTYRYNDSLSATMLFFYSDPGQIYAVHHPSVQSPQLILSDYRREAHNAVIQMAGELGTGIAFINSENGVYMIRNLVDRQYHPYAALVMQLSPTAVFGSFSRISGETNSIAFLNGVSVTTCSAVPENDCAVERMELSTISGLADRAQRMEETIDGYRVYGRLVIDAVDIGYIVEIEKDYWKLDHSAIKHSAALLGLFLLPLLGFSAFFFHRQVSLPISRIAETVSTVGNGGLGAQVSIAAPNEEFGLLIDSFNQMSSQVSAQFQNVYDEELAFRDARIAAFQNRLNPYFIRIALDTVGREVQSGNRDKAANVLSALRIIAEAALDPNSASMVPLPQELDYTDAMLLINTLHSGHRIQFYRNLSPELANRKVPRLILQSAMELALTAAEQHPGSFTVCLRATRNGDFMWLVVEYNAPISPDQLDAITRALSPDGNESKLPPDYHPLLTIRTRLRAVYGDAGSLSVESDAEKTTITHYIPLS